MGCASLGSCNPNMSKLNIDLAWDSIRWAKVRSRVLRMQHRIFKAKRNGLDKTVAGLQIRLIDSLDARLISVLQVTTYNKGRKTAGVDRISVTKPEAKLAIALGLSIDGKAHPIRRVWIPKPGKSEKRPLGMPTIMDKAKQQLAMLALEPEWEAVFEPNSYGFRKGRSCHDAIEAIFLNLSKGRPKYVFDADIRKCFDRINHDALLRKLSTFPQMERQVRAWLKAGIMDGFSHTSKEYTAVPENTIGRPQGGIISPLLANVALHGLEANLKEFCARRISTSIYKPKSNSAASRAKACGVIRYADDFVVIHENKQVIELCIEETKRWLADIGLEISEEKSKLIDDREGFKFLGFRIVLVRKGRHPNQPYKVKIVPAKENCLKLLDKVRVIVRKAKAWSAYDLIKVIRPIILGWGNYYSTCECKNVFAKLENSMFGMLRAWVFRRDHKSGRLKVKEKYFPSGGTYIFRGKTYKDNWVLCGQRKMKKGKMKKGITAKIFLPRLFWVKSKKFVKISGNKSPYDGDYLYWGKRLAKYSGLSNAIIKLLNKQDFKCNYCKARFMLGEQMEMDHIIPKSRGGGDKYENLQVLHKVCHVAKTREDSPLISI